MQGIIQDKESLIRYIWETLGDDNEYAATIVLFENYEEAFVGLAVKEDLKPCLVYDYWKMVELYMMEDDIDIEDAIIHINDNYIDTHYGDQSPIVIELCRQIVR